MDKHREGKTEFCHIHTIDIESKDNVYTNDEDHENTHKFTKKGKFVESWGQFRNEEVRLKDGPLIIFDSKANLYVKDTQNQPIQVFSTDAIKLKI